MSGLFKSKKVTPEVSVLADPYKNVRTSLTDYLTGNIGKPAEQYSGEMIATMSSQEKASLGFLDQYAAAQPSKIYGLGAEEISKTLKGEYDPSKSPYYQAVKAAAKQNLDESLADISDLAAGGGSSSRYWTGARLGEQAGAITDTTNALNMLLGQLSESERERKFQAAPIAAELGKYEEEAPLRKASALQEYGALPRAIQQELDQAVMNEWLRATQEYPLNIAQLAAGVQEAPLYGETGYAPSVFQQILSSSMLGNLAGNLFDKKTDTTKTTTTTKK